MPLGLAQDTLLFEFPDIHEAAVLEVTFRRTLRIPDDGRTYDLPPNLGTFPVRAVDDLIERSCPHEWRRRGGVALPMGSAEACWIRFHSPFDYPFAVKVAAGKINALTGAQWSEELDFEAGDYMEVPGQPWLDGFCVGNDVVRQFVAMPLGAGYTAEEQITGTASHGGIQILARPMEHDAWRARLRAAQAEERARLLAQHQADLAKLDEQHAAGWLRRHTKSSPYRGGPMRRSMVPGWEGANMGLGAGGLMRQKVRKPEGPPELWDSVRSARCFVHLAPASAWRALTGKAPPGKVGTALSYMKLGFPWFRHVDPTGRGRGGSPILAGLKSVLSISQRRGNSLAPDDAGFDPPEPVLVHNLKSPGFQLRPNRLMRKPRS